MSLEDANRNSATSTGTHGHSYERFQAPQILRPINTVSKASLKQAADTSLAQFTIPASWGSAQILYIGAHVATATGAQTTEGSMKATIGGVDVEDLNEDPIEATFPAAGADIWTPIEQSLNRTTRELNLLHEPNFPVLLAHEVLELRVATQGVGAGTQEVFPYIIARVSPGNSNADERQGD